MNIWYLVAFPAWLVLALTAAARLADSEERHTFIDHLRILAWVGIGTTSVLILAGPWLADWWLSPPSTWRGTMMGYSWAVAEIAKRGIVPWWDFIIGVHRKTESWKGMGVLCRLAGEGRALRDSFRPRRYRQKPLDGPQGPLP